MEKLNSVYSALKSEYKDWNISDSDLRNFAESLYDHVFVQKGRLLEIFVFVSNFEEMIMWNDGDNDNNEYISNECYVFDDMIDLIDACKENTERLYNTFLEFRDPNLFSTLMTKFDEWLTNEQKEELMSIARGEFDKIIWDMYE